MTVQELIEQLQKLPQNSRVFFEYWESAGESSFPVQKEIFNVHIDETGAILDGC